MRTTYTLFIVVLLATNITVAQIQDADSTSIATTKKINYRSLIAPSVLLTYGVIGIESDGLQLLNIEIKEEVTEHIDQKITIDDFSQYAPAIAVYGLNAFGIKGKHNFGNRTLILATSFVLIASSVTGLKTITRVQRPDGTARNSWPSGHTATAFMGAEFLWQEYKDVSIWYGISGYLVAAGTGGFRIYNDRHWFTDVAAGAGIGILSTKIAYWLHPWLRKAIFKKEGAFSLTDAQLVPFHSEHGTGLGMQLSF